MDYRLPYDLEEAEKQLYRSLINYISNSEQEKKHIDINLKFDGLRLNPVVSRLSDKLSKDNYKNILLWADAGGAALAKRDMPDKSNNIFTYKEYLLKKQFYLNHFLIAVSPQAFDIDEFEPICNVHKSSLIMINGKLEDSIVGIGTVGRERRKRFNNLWQSIYYIEPLSKGALMRAYPNNWHLFENNTQGYIFKECFDIKPNDETILLNL